MKKNTSRNLESSNALALQPGNPSCPTFEGYHTQYKTRADIEALIREDADYANFNNDSDEDQIAESINIRKKILAEVNIFKLDLDFKRQERHTANERWQAKNGFFDILKKVGKKIEAFISPAAALYRAQKEIAGNDEKSLRRQFELEIEGLQDKLDAVKAYLATADAELLTEGVAKFGSVKAFIIDMKSNPNSPHYQEINDMNKYLLQLAIQRFNGNDMTNSVGVYETSEQDEKPKRKTINGLVGLRESQKIQRSLNKGLTSIEANMADIASTSTYVRKILVSNDKQTASRPEWMSTKLSPMEGVLITYNPKNGEAVMLDELSDTQELTSTGMLNYQAQRKAARKESAKRWFGHGLKAAFAAGMLLLAGKGAENNVKQMYQDKSEAVASATASAKSGPVANGVAVSHPVEAPVTSDQPVTPKLDKVAKRPVVTAQNPAKAKVSTWSKKTNPILEGEAKKTPVAKKPTVKVQVAKKIEAKKTVEKVEKTEKQDLLNEEAKKTALNIIIARVAIFQSRFSHIEKSMTPGVQFPGVTPTLTKLPTELDLVFSKAKSLETKADILSANQLLDRIEGQLSGMERTITVQKITTIHAATMLDVNDAMAFLDVLMSKLGNRSHKFGIKKVTYVAESSKDSYETTSIMLVDLDAAQVALKKIMARTHNINQSEADANKDLAAAKKWLGHIKYVKYHVEKGTNITE